MELGQIKRDKQLLREYYKRILAAMSTEEQTTESAAITAAVLRSSYFAQAHVLMCYLNMGSEVDTTTIVQTALREGKQVFAPVVVGERLLAARIDIDTQYKISEFGIREPEVRPVEPGLIGLELVIVPGLAFTQSGQRLGRGKGYYDRLLRELPQVTSIGLAYSQQVATVLPIEPHDVQVKFVAIS